MGYNQGMDILARLEVEVHSLVDENLQLKASLERALAECSALQNENQTMRHALAAEKAVREQALARIDALTGKLEGHLDARRSS